MNKKIPSDKNKSSLQIFGRVSGLGITFALITCIGGFIGYKADIIFNVKPIFTCLGTACGFILALISIYLIIKKDIL